jgi:ParB family transcriptional regulator, chromosome partitioning protein
VKMIETSLIRDNDWNPNQVDPDIYTKLVASIKERGILEPLKLMPHDEGYVLVDGFHRWKAAVELKMDMVPAEVWELSVEEAKIRGLQLNYMRGQPVPARLARLVHDLSTTIAIPDLSKIVPWTQTQLLDSLELLKMPMDIEGRVAAQAAAAQAIAPVPVTVALVGKEFKLFEAAMEHAKGAQGAGNRRGSHLAAICDRYLQEVGQPITPDAESPT